MTDKYKYILDREGQPIPADFDTWVQWYEREGIHTRRVAQTEVAGRFIVSTVFLGLDHNFSGVGDPILWESMTFPVDANGMTNWSELATQRYTSLAEAQAGHAEMVAEAEGWAREASTSC